jgi:hypothetical protein
LACFKGKDKTPLGKPRGDSGKEIKWLSQAKPPPASKAANFPIIERNRTISCHNNFNERVVIMQYDNIDVYVDNSTHEKHNSKDSRDSNKLSRKSFSEGEPHDEFLEYCVKVVTEETASKQHSLSTHQMTPNSLTPRSSELEEEFNTYECYEPKPKEVRIRRTVTSE